MILRDFTIPVLFLILPQLGKSFFPTQGRTGSTHIPGKVDLVKAVDPFLRKLALFAIFPLKFYPLFQFLVHILRVAITMLLNVREQHLVHIFPFLAPLSAYFPGKVDLVKKFDTLLR